MLRTIAGLAAGAIPAAAATWYFAFAAPATDAAGPAAAIVTPDGGAAGIVAGDAAAAAGALAVYRRAAAIDDAAALEAELRQLLAAPFAPGRDTAIGALFRRLAALDLERALSLAESPGFDSRHVAELARALAVNDPEAGLAVLAAVRDPAHRRAVALALADAAGTTPGALDRIAALLPVELRIDFQAGALGALAAEDPNRALGIALVLADPAARNTAVQRVGVAWAETDPHGAISRTDSLPADLQDGYRTGIALAWARQDVAEFLGFIDGEPRLDAYLVAMHDAIAANPELAFEVASRHPPVPIGGGFGANYTIEREAFTAIAGADRDRALALLDAMPRDARRQELMVAFAETYGRKDPIAARAWAESVEPPNPALLSAVITRAALADLDLALDWLAEAEVPAGPFATANPAATTIGVSFGSDPRRVDMANTLSGRDDPNSRQALVSLMRVWVLTDPPSAIDWVLSSNMAFDAQLASNLSSALAQRNAPAAAALVDRVPAEVRSNWLLSVAAPYATQNPAEATAWVTRFSGEPGYEDMVGRIVQQTAAADPESAARLLPLAPAAVQRNTAMRIAGAWANQDLAQAGRWAAGLADEAARNGAVSQVAMSWSARDPAAAQRWAASLPRGATRDQGLIAVIGRLGRDADYVETIDWNLLDAFDSAAQRETVVAGIAGPLAAQNEAQARALVERWVTDPAQRERANQAIDAAGGN